ncbi:MAG: DUF1924 domain-containing protein [Chromatiales bacterium]|jgi:hypothetical protein
MLKKKHYVVLLLLWPIAAYSGSVETLLDTYRQQGAKQFSAGTGESLWTQVNTENKRRSCSDCHGSDLSQVGKHAKTGKRIEPMAPSANPQRLTDMAKIEKWFKRNCKWTLGRACTPQEKGDFLIFLQQQ